MPYHMMVAISATEKKKVLNDLIDEMSISEMETAMLRIARGFKHLHSDEEREQLLKKIKTAMYPTPVRAPAYVPSPKNQTSGSKLRKLMAASEGEL